MALLIPMVFCAQKMELEKGEALFSNGAYVEAKAYFLQYVALEDASDQAYYLLGRTEFYLHNYDKAVEYLKQAIEINNERSGYHHWLGETYLQKLQRASFFEKGILSGKVLDHYHKAVKLDPANVDARISLASYYLNAPSIGGGSISKAKEQVGEIRKYNPGQAAVLTAQIYVQEENYDLALAEFDSYLQENPDNTDVLYQIGMLYQGLKRYEDATAAFERVVQADPEAYASLYQVGRTAVFWGENIDRGIAALSTYLSARPGAPNPGPDAAHWRLGMLYELKGNDELAMNEYALALELKPGEEKYQKAIADLQ